MTRLPFATLIFAITTIMLFLQACSESVDEANSAVQTVSVNLLYPQQVEVPEQAEILVVLEDQSEATAPKIIDRKAIPVTLSAPSQVSLQYLPDTVTDRGKYAVRGEVLVDNRVVLSGSQTVDLSKTIGSGFVELELKKGALEQQNSPQASTGS